MKRECSGKSLDSFFLPKVVPAIMLVWKFLKVVTSVLLLGDVIPKTSLPVVSLCEQTKYLILSLSQS